MGWESGSGGAPAAVHHLGLELGFEGLDLAQDGEAAGGSADMALQLVEDLVQPLGGGPEGRVVLSNGGVHVHDGLRNFLDFMIVIADDLG